MRNKYFSLLILLIVNCPKTNGQFTDRYWCFGDSSAIDFRNLNNPVPANSILRSRGTCASICDSIGNLLFYGSTPHVSLWLTPNLDNYGYILNNNHQVMQNGDTIATATWYQEMIITPDPGNSNRFYLFTTGVTTPTGFFYNVIDLSFNGGLGKVTQKNIQLQNFTVSDGLAAVKHGNGRDWWVIMKKYSNTIALDEFYIYLVSPTGISAPIIQHIGYPIISGGFLRLKFSNNGDKLFAVAPDNLIESYDFNRCTGVLSNVNTISPNNYFPTSKHYWSFALSPDVSKLYTTSIYLGSNQDTSYLVQYNLNATNVLASADTLHTFIRPEITGLLQIGPDNKIYLSCDYEKTDCGFNYLYCDTTRNYVTNNISVINFPDSLGSACNYQPFSFYLGGHRTYFGLPNNPNYELKPDSGSVCDTLHVGLNELFVQTGNLFVYYDTQWITAFINANKLKGKSYSLTLYDVTGREIFNAAGKLVADTFTLNLDMSNYETGMYLISFTTEKEKMVKKFLKN